MITNETIMQRPLDWMKNSTLQGLVALVAGGGSGIGESVATILAANGAKVVVADRKIEAAEQVVTAIAGRGGEALAVRMDVTSQSDIDSSLEIMGKNFGGMDILVNCAGAIQPSSLEEASLEEWNNSFEVNVVGALLLGRSCLPHLRKSKAAAIVNVASLAGRSAYPNGGPYGPSKAALISLTQQMALEWVADGIRVNVVSPGTIDTPLMRSNMRPEIVAQREARIPMGRLGLSSEVADTIVFLASPAASYITGQELCCDGGLSQSLMVQKFYANT